ncbi:MAG: peptidoglycan-binding domain-containing protein [Pseudomonadota bacterium]
MKISVRTLQARLAALGCHPGPIDGLNGKRTRAALADALAFHNARSARDLFGPDGLHCIVGHWTAGAYGRNAVEERSYNLLIDQHGVEHPGQFEPETQANYAVGRAASHTRHANTGRIGVAMDAMAGANERPFRRGSAPLTWPQVQGYVSCVATLCERFWIPVTRWSVLTHAEVQPTLGIAQRFKWDVTWLPDMSAPGDPIDVGDRLRDMIRAAMSEAGEAA